MNEPVRTESHGVSGLILGPSAKRAARAEFYFTHDEWVENLVSRVEELLRKLTGSEIELMDAIGKHMLFGYAKRLRPIFVLLSNHMFAGKVSETAIECAAATELIHCASLFHDDVIDDAKTRKGRRAANAVWGNRSAVIMGDQFFVLAYTLLIKQRDFRVLDLFVSTCRALAEGIMMEIGNVRNIDVSIESHLDIIAHKTAGFFKTAALVGGYIAGANSEQEKHLERFGLNFGLAFQLSDDMLDLFAEPKATGKHRGADLMGGIYTVPVIHALNGSSEFKDRFLPSLIEDSLTPEKIDEIASYLRNNGAFDFSLGLVKHYGEKALEHLAELPEGKANDSFRILTEKIIKREY